MAVVSLEKFRVSGSCFFNGGLIISESALRPRGKVFVCVSSATTTAAAGSGGKCCVEAQQWGRSVASFDTCDTRARFPSSCGFN